MISIYGAIGYCFLKKDKKKVLIFSDMHSKLPYCNNSVKMSDWLLSKSKSSTILLEEVERTNNIKLDDLWTESEHTQDLKELFLQNPHVIQGIDIRFHLIPFSWEIIEFKTVKMTLKDYLNKIEYFFNNQNNIKSEKIKKHFNKTKKIFTDYLNNNKELLLKNLNDIPKDKLQEISDILDLIMELYVCAQIESDSNKNIIVHIGLSHSEQIINNLIKLYNYDITKIYGNNEINNVSVKDGCVGIDKYINEQFF